MKVPKHKRMTLAALHLLDSHLTTRSYNEVHVMLEAFFQEVCEDHLRQYQRGYHACERKWKRKDPTDLLRSVASGPLDHTAGGRRTQG